MLTIRPHRSPLALNIPRAVFIDGMFAGTVNAHPLCIDVPAGTYSLRVQFGGRLPLGRSGKSINLALSSTRQIVVPPDSDVLCEFRDRERLWNILFDIDLVVWVISWFVSLPQLYTLLSDAFFAIWLLRLVLIRNNYYSISITTLPHQP